MSVTLDREVTNTAVLRQVDDLQIDPHQTGFRLPVIFSWSAHSLTHAESEGIFLVAGHQWPGSFLPVVHDETTLGLSELLSYDWMIEASLDEDDPMVLPAPLTRRVTLRVRQVSYGVPSPIAFED